MVKGRLNHRLHPDLIKRLRELKASQKLSMEDLISDALDALEREVYLPETLLERVENLEVQARLIIKKVELLDQKSMSADQIKYFFQVLEKQLVDHDEAEIARLRRIHGPHLFD
ncbi:hypothetical protein [Geomonas subterranea]|uniref:hypothetical protein n=1 Tax=Geomonas subterranea TaxID=2847989 RepID=UPI001CD5825E|nr:hypothetical protein [Geomonas fuzhouensis]